MTQYDFSHTTYPIDLLDSEEYGGNRLLIWINETQDTRLTDNFRENRKYVDASAVSPRETPKIRDASASDSDRQDAVNVGIVLGLLPVGSAIGATNISVPAGGLLSFGNRQISKVAPQSERTVRRLRKAIALYMPNKLTIKYGTQWDETNTYLLSALLGATPSLAEAVKSLVNRPEETTINTPSGQQTYTPSLQDQLGRNVADATNAIDGLRDTGIGNSLFPNIALASPFLGDAISSATRLANNPKKEQVFQGVAFRDFSLEYDFFARSEDEGRAIQEIIYQLKYHMHPELKSGTGDFLWTYPSEFDLEYIQGNSSNNVIHRHTSCVLMSLDVDYTPDGVYHQLPNGEPQKIKITMNFKELVLLDKQKIAERNY